MSTSKLGVNHRRHGRCCLANTTLSKRAKATSTQIAMVVYGIMWSLIHESHVCDMSVMVVSRNTTSPELLKLQLVLLVSNTSNKCTFKNESKVGTIDDDS